MDLNLGLPANAAAPAVIDATSASFETDVLLASRDTTIIVDFWAPWCGPCRQLTPALEKVIGATKGKARLVKVNIDENPELAQALRVQSIPTVYAFVDGRPVDGFQGALPESQLKQFLDRVLATAGPDAAAAQIAEALDQAREAEEQGDAETAAEIYAAVAEADPENPGAQAGLLRLQIAAGDLEGAKAALAALSDSVRKDPALVAVATSIELAEQAAKAGPLTELEGKVAADPDDHQSRLDLALGRYAAGDREGAVDALLDSVRRDRAWNEGEARKQLVKFFEAFGPTDPLTIAGRKRLSSILFS